MRRDRGSATVVALFLVATAAMGMIGVGSLTSLYAARNHASTAADAAALAAAVATYPPAGAESPLVEARRYARLNAATLQTCRCPVDSTLKVRVVTVIVELKTRVPCFGVLPVRAGARAEFDPQAWLGRHP
ncbi:MAG TPA: pilus assembly protein TadG-related protein [Acidimicrobiia bacterium]